MDTLQYNHLVTQGAYEKAGEAILKRMKTNISEELFGHIPEGAWTYIRWRIEHEELDGRVGCRLVIETSEMKDEVIEMLEGRLDRSYLRGAKLEQLCRDLYRIAAHEAYIDDRLHNRLVELGFAKGEQND